MSLFKRKNDIWHYCIRMADGERHMRTTGTRDRAKARAIYDRARTEAADIRSGRLKPNHAAIRKAECAPLAASLDAYEAGLIKAGRSPAHIRQTRSKIERTAAATEPPALRAADLGLEHIEEVHKQLHVEGRSRCTMNGYQTACKAFLNWLVDHKRLETNPIRLKKRMKTSDDRRRQRRFAAPQEFDILLKYTRQSAAIRRKMDGKTRAALYRLAGHTGLRANELRSLSRSDFDLPLGLDQDPSVSLRAKGAKNRKESTIPIPPDDAYELHLCGLTKHSARARPFETAKRTADMLRQDMAEARAAWIAAAKPDQRPERESSEFLKPVNARGEHFDFHALRHTFVNLLRLAGVDVKTAQTLARHSDPRLTLNIYSHTTNPEQRAAVVAIAKLGRKEIQP